MRSFIIKPGRKQLSFPSNPFSLSGICSHLCYSCRPLVLLTRWVVATRCRHGVGSTISSVTPTTENSGTIGHFIITGTNLMGFTSVLLNGCCIHTWPLCGAHNWLRSIVPVAGCVLTTAAGTVFQRGFQAGVTRTSSNSNYGQLSKQQRHHQHRHRQAFLDPLPPDLDKDGLLELLVGQQPAPDSLRADGRQQPASTTGNAHYLVSAALPSMWASTPRPTQKGPDGDGLQESSWEEENGPVDLRAEASTAPQRFLCNGDLYTNPLRYRPPPRG
jgi:hypothetical protein